MTTGEIAKNVEKKKTVTDPKIDAAAREKLVTARIGLLLKAPFFGNLATRMKLINADEWLSTIATDGRNFYYNSEFVNKMPLKQMEFGVGHEVLHAVYDHIGRTGSRDRRIANIAQDYCVNADLIDQRVGEKISVVPILFDAKYKGWSFEEVYDDLMQNAKKMNIDQLASQLLDEHLEGDNYGDNEGDGDGNSGKPRVSEEDRKAIRDEIKEAMLQAANACGASNLPAGVRRMLKDLTAPVMNWRELLQQQIESTFKSDFTWMKPSRRGWHMDAVMPGMKPGNTVDVCVAIDTSGSISERDLKIFLSEVKGIMEAYDDYRVHIWTFDTAVYNPQVFTMDNLNDILEYDPQGGGGTDFMANWEFMKDNDIEPKKLVVFTDGYPYGSWGDPDYCDTCWIIKGNRDAEPPFGVWAIYENELAKAA